MRIIHTSDWHIGRVWSGLDLLDTQRQFGAWLCDLVKTEKIDAVLVAGDIYDRAVPSAEAVSLADEIFTNLSAAGALTDKFAAAFLSSIGWPDLGAVLRYWCHRWTSEGRQSLVPIDSPRKGYIATLPYPSRSFEGLEVPLRTRQGQTRHQ